MWIPAVALAEALVLTAVSPAVPQAPASASSPSAPPPPNIVIIFADDLGYGDIGCYGGNISTPNIDRLAADGVRLTDFSVAQAVCSASRAALLTGCYPNRIGIAGALGPNAKIGLAEGETTIAEVCRQRGYATAIFGKWHLGDRAPFLPLQHGFDEYYGLPYSNDMWPLHPDLAKLPPDAEARKRGYPNLPLFEGEKIIDDEVTADDQAMLTSRYTERAVEFIERQVDHARRPILLYLAHSMPHVPLFVSPKRTGATGLGQYADVIAEIDWSVGQVLAAIDRVGARDNTLVIFTSDNGPWLSYGEHAGSAGPLREGKGTAWEGGVRVPCVMRFPPRIPAGSVCKEPLMTIDVLPTVAGLIGAKLPEKRIDGLDALTAITGERAAEAGPVHEALYYYYASNELRAVRSGRWKLVLPHAYTSAADIPRATGGTPSKYVNRKVLQPELYDLEADMGEARNVAADHPDIVARLTELAERARADLGDSLTKRTGANVREPGRVQE